VTEREEAVISLAIEWRETKFAVGKALVESALIHAIDMLKKERRDAKADQGEHLRPGD